MVNSKAVALAERLEAASIAGVLDVVPTIPHRSRCITIRCAQTSPRLRGRLERDARLEARCAEGVEPRCRRDSRAIWRRERAGSRWRCFGVPALTEDDVVARHTEVTYRVFMLGFLPGFAYMAERRPTNRTSAPSHTARQGSRGLGRDRRPARRGSTRWTARAAGISSARPTRNSSTSNAPNRSCSGRRPPFTASESDLQSEWRSIPTSSDLVCRRPSRIWAVGMAGAGRAGGRTDGSFFSSSRQRARRQRSSDAATLEVALVGPEIAVRR